MTNITVTCAERNITSSVLSSNHQHTIAIISVINVVNYAPGSTYDVLMVIALQVVQYSI